MIRMLFAVLIGVLVGGIVVAALQAVSMFVFPAPPGMDPANQESVAAAIAAIPLGALLMVLLSWGLGAFAGGWTAARIARPQGPSIARPPVAASMVVGFALWVSGLIAMIQIPHPFWFWIPGLLLPIPCALLGARVARPRPA